MTVSLRRPYASAARAERLAAAVRADDPEFVAVTVEGRELAIRLTVPSPARARATLDDLLACLNAAERAVPDA